MFFNPYLYCRFPIKMSQARKCRYPKVQGLKCRTICPLRGFSLSYLCKKDILGLLLCFSLFLYWWVEAIFNYICLTRGPLNTILLHLKGFKGIWDIISKLFVPVLSVPQNNIAGYSLRFWGELAWASAW